MPNNLVRWLINQFADQDFRQQAQSNFGLQERPRTGGPRPFTSYERGERLLPEGVSALDYLLQAIRDRISPESAAGEVFGVTGSEPRLPDPANAGGSGGVPSGGGGDREPIGVRGADGKIDIPTLRQGGGFNPPGYRYPERTNAGLQMLLESTGGSLSGGGATGGQGGFTQVTTPQSELDARAARDAETRAQMAQDALTGAVSYWTTLAMQTGNPRHILAAQSAQQEYSRYMNALANQMQAQRYGTQTYISTDMQ